jgi:hypothetical protein
VDLQDVCNGTGGELYVGKNNVELFATNEQTTTATTRRISNNLAVDGNRCTTTSQYFDCGSNPTLATGPTFYRAKTGGGLDGTGTCDPDGDGVAGVDYDGNGTNDTTWKDLVGNTVTCTTLSTAIDIGAVAVGLGIDLHASSDGAEPPSDGQVEPVSGRSRRRAAPLRQGTARSAAAGIR